MSSSLILGTVKAINYYGFDYIRTATAISGFLSTGMAICFKFPSASHNRPGFAVIESSDSNKIIVKSSTVINMSEGDLILPYSSELIVYINGRPRTLLVKP